MPRYSRTSIFAANLQADAMANSLDGGTLSIYTAPRPTWPEDAATGILLAVLELGTPAFGAAVDGMITANPITPENSALADGIAAWFRARTALGQSVLDGTVGTEDCDLELSSTTIAIGDTVECNLFQHTVERIDLGTEDVSVLSGGTPGTVFP